MKLSTAINELEQLKSEHGDLELVDDNEQPVDFEFVAGFDGEDDVICVTA